MSDIRITSVRFDVNQAGLERQAQPILRRTHSSLTRQIDAQAKVNAPVRTGHLGRSVREDPQTWPSPLHVSGGVTAHAKYAAAVHQGSRPHVIRPRTKKALAFVWRGQPVVFRSVNHPGTKARPFLLNAARQVIAADPRVT